MSPIVWQSALGLYAFLLGIGGIVGYLKAGSKPSLIAGLSSALLALTCLMITTQSRPVGLGLAMVLAALLTALFSMRFAKNHKFMPSGMLTVISLIMLVLMAAGAFLSA
jgi:uncharacterized membrane protein (UPF0136 family)